MKPNLNCSLRRIARLATAQAVLLLTGACATTSATPLFQVSNLDATYHVPGELGIFEQQFAQIAAALENHTGPIILSGDFNTWRHGRMAIIDKLAAKLALEPLSFHEDHRMRVMGRFLDHIYVRGLTALQSSSRLVNTSDHRPMSVTLTM